MQLGIAVSCTGQCSYVIISCSLLACNPPFKFKGCDSKGSQAMTIIVRLRAMNI